MSDVFKLSEQIHIDARRAVWLPASRILALADMHLGESWARRARGQLVPVGQDEDTLRRLHSLIEHYRPEKTVILGDIVHAAIPLDGIESALRSLVKICSGLTQLELCLGNHDRQLARRLKSWNLHANTSEQFESSEAILFHGDTLPNINAGDSRWRIFGHEHPAVVLGDGVATYAKVPCFLEGPDMVVLPAFSNWAGGCVVGRDAFLGETARLGAFTHAIACMGTRLLRMPWTSGQTASERRSIRMPGRKSK